MGQERIFLRSLSLGVWIKIASHINTRTYTDNTMPTRTISITEEAYQKLKSLKSSDKDSFSDVIIRYYPSRRKLSEVLSEIGVDAALADSIEAASQKMRHARIREAEL